MSPSHLLRRVVRRRHRGGARERGAPPSRAAALVIIGALVTLVFVKLEFRLPHSNIALYAYGVTVTTVVLIQMTVALLRYKDPAVTVPADPATITAAVDGTDGPPLVSCMVAVHNEINHIADCLRSLTAQTYERREIIIVDDASTDGTAAVLAALPVESGVRVIALADNVGKKSALAAAIAHASGEIFAFSDSDSVWAPDALERAVSIFLAHPDVGAVSGHCRALNADQNLLTRIQDSWYEGQFSVRKAFESTFGAVTCVSGPLAVFRREAVFNFIPAWTDDRFCGQAFRFATDRTLTAFVLMPKGRALRIKQRYPSSPFTAVDYPWCDWRVVYSKSCRSWTVVPHTFSCLVKQQVRWKKSFLRNLFVTGSFYWRRPLLPALVYYLHAVFVLAGPLVAFRHLIYLPLRGDLESGILYLCGIALVGSMFALALRREDPHSPHWFYRPLMSLMSTILLSWLVFYSLVTIRRMHWSRS